MQGRHINNCNELGLNATSNYSIYKKINTIYICAHTHTHTHTHTQIWHSRGPSGGDAWLAIYTTQYNRHHHLRVSSEAGEE